MLTKKKEKHSFLDRLRRRGKVKVESHVSVENPPMNKPPIQDAIEQAEIQPEALSSKIDTIRLDHIFPEQSKIPKIATAQLKLQTSTEELAAVLESYSDKFDFHKIGSEEIGAITSTEGNKLLPVSIKTFDQLVNHVVTSREKEAESISGKVSSFLKQVYPLATVALGVVSFAADAATFPPLKFTANALSQVITLAAKAKDKGDLIDSGLSKLMDYQTHVSRFRELNLSDSSSEMVSIAANAILLLVAITDFFRDSIIYLKQSLIKGIVKAGYQDDTVSKSQGALDSAAKEFKSSIVDAVSLMTLKRYRLQLDENLLKGISEMDFKKTQIDTRSKRLKRTGKWILNHQQFKQWLNGKQSRLWCPGRAGVGKTLLTSRILDHICPEYLQDEPRSTTMKRFGVAFLYCEWGRRSEQTALNLFKSITRQLVERRMTSSNWPETRDEVEKFLKGHKAPDIVDYLSFLPLVIAKFERVFVVIDALDELDADRHRDELVKALTRLANIQLLVTSRDHISPIENSTIVKLQSDLKDIKAYVEFRISQSERLKGCLEEEPSLMQDILVRVKVDYSNIFNLARLLMDFLQTQKSPGKIAEALESLPPDEEDFYGKSLKRIFDKGDVDSPDSGLKIISWVLFAKRPLRMQELLEAVAFSSAQDPDKGYRRYLVKEWDVLDSCAGLLVLEPESATVRFAHLTVEEYLKTKGNIALSALQSNLTHVLDDGEDIFKVCLSYINHYGSKGFKATNPAPYPLLLYACKYWPHHVLSMCQDPSGKLVKPFPEEAIELLEDNDTFKLSTELWLQTNFHGEKLSPDLAQWWPQLPSNFGNIINHGEDFDLDLEGRGIIYAACDLNHEGLVKLLLDGGIDINANNGFGPGKFEMPLHRAAGNGNKRIVKLLLTHPGCDVDSGDGYGQTPLSRAAESGNEQVVALLLGQNSVNADTRDLSGQTPLSWAATNGSGTAVRHLLDREDVDPNSQDLGGKTPLSWAASGGHRIVVETLLKDDRVNINTRDLGGQSAFGYAQDRNHKSVVELLLGHKDIDVFGTVYNTSSVPPAPIDLDSVIERLLEVQGRRPRVNLLAAEVLYLCLRAREIFMSQDVLLELETPVTICGDIRGHFVELLRIFERGGFPPDVAYLFLGNYVGGQEQPLETICLLLALKIRYPEKVFLLRGNQESENSNAVNYGFYYECKGRYNMKIWRTFLDCFNCMPIAAIIDEKIFAVHGGLSPDLVSIKQIQHIRRPIDIPNAGLLCDLLWSDPNRDIIGWAENDRGISFEFGADVVDRFLEKNGIDLICRSHHIVEDGFEFFAKRKLVTVFSAANMYGEFDNDGAVMEVDEELQCSFHAWSENKTRAYRQ